MWGAPKNPLDVTRGILQQDDHLKVYRLDLWTPHGIMTAWSRGTVTTQQALLLLDVESEREPIKTCISSDVALPGEPT